MVYRAIMAPFLRLDAPHRRRVKGSPRTRVCSAMKLRGLAVIPCRTHAAPSQVGAARSQAHNGG